MKKYLLCLLAAVFMALGMAAQSPVRWRISIRMTSPTEGELDIKALISDGWHLYGFDMPDGGPKPTRFDFADCLGVQFNGDIRPSESPIVQYDPLFGKKLSWWDRNVIFSRPFTVSDRKDARIKVSVTFMSCNGGTCTPPRTETITTDIPQYNPSQLSKPDRK